MAPGAYETAIEKVISHVGRTATEVRWATAFAGEGKTDAVDAKVIAGTARLHRDLTEITTSGELVVELSPAPATERTA